MWFSGYELRLQFDNIVNRQADSDPPPGLLKAQLVKKEVLLWSLDEHGLSPTSSILVS